MGKGSICDTKMMRQGCTLYVHDNAFMDPGDAIRNVSIRHSGLCVVTE